MFIIANGKQNFQAGKFRAESLKRVTSFRIPAKNDATIVADVVEYTQNQKNKVTNINYRLMKKGQVVEEKAFQNKKGFADERFASICEKIQTKVKEGYDFMNELFDALYYKP